jgi:hypothetical protein
VTYYPFSDGTWSQLFTQHLEISPLQHLIAQVNIKNKKKLEWQQIFPKLISLRSETYVEISPALNCAAWEQQLADIRKIIVID